MSKALYQYSFFARIDLRIFCHSWKFIGLKFIALNNSLPSPDPVIKGSCHNIQDSFFWRQDTLSGIVWAGTAQGGTSRSHTSNILPARLAGRVWCIKFQSSLFNIQFRLSGTQASLLPIYFRDRPNRCSLCTKVCDASLLRSVRCSFAPSQKSRRHNRCRVLTEALYSIIFVNKAKVAVIPRLYSTLAYNDIFEWMKRGGKIPRARKKWASEVYVSKKGGLWAKRF